MNNAQARAAGQLIGHLLFFAFLIGAGFAAGKWLGARRATKRFVWWPSAIAAALVALSLIGAAGNAAAASSGAVVKAEVMRRKLPAGAQFRTDAASLRKMEAQAALVASRAPNAPADPLVVKMSLLPRPAEGIVLQRSWHGDNLINSELLAIRNGDFVGVNCTTASETVAPKFKRTACAAAAKQALGIDLSTIAGDF